jgi:hypothetical protein
MSPSEFEAMHARRDERAGPMTWEQIAEFLTWAESQLPPEQQRNRPRRHPANESPLPLNAGPILS